jgi:hypothetical protein
MAPQNLIVIIPHPIYCQWEMMSMIDSEVQSLSIGGVK